MSFSYEKWKAKDNERIKSQSVSVKPFEEWNTERSADTNSKAQMISQGLNGISMGEFRKKNPSKMVEESPQPKVTETPKKAKETKKESKNVFSQAWDWTRERSASAAESMKEDWSGFGKDVKKASGVALDVALEALGHTSPTGAGVFKGSLKKDNENNQLSEKVGSNLRAGTGDFIEQAGQGLKYLGAEKIGKELMGTGKNVSDGFGEAYKGGKEFTWNNLLDPEYYATNVTRQVPQMATMVMGGGVGLGVKGLTSLTKLPTVAKTVLSVTGGAGAMTAIESAMEAGGVYEEAKSRGMNETDAKSAADETFKKNLALTGGTSLIEMGLGLSPLTRGVSRMGIGKQIVARTVGGGATEGLQEGLQEKISTEALGDEFNWTDPSTVEAMVIGGLLGGATTGGMASVQLANNPQNNSFNTIARDTIDSMSDERRAEFDELVDVGRQQGKSFVEAQFDALEDLASRYEDVVENTRQSTQNFIDNEKLQRAKSTSFIEQNQKEQVERNTMNYDLAESLPEYQFNGAAIAENPDVTSVQMPPQAKMLQQLLQQPSLPLQTQMQTAEFAPNALPQSPNNQLIPPAIQTNPLPTNMNQLNVPSTPPPVNNEVKQLNTPSPEVKNFGDLQAGDEIKLKGTKAETTYTVVEDDGGKMVKVKTSADKTINVPRNSINEIVMRVSEANVMADQIDDIPTLVEPLENNGVELPVQTDAANEIKLPPNFNNKMVINRSEYIAQGKKNFTNKIVRDINELIAQGQNVEIAIDEVRNRETYQMSQRLLEEFDKVVAESFSRSTEQEIGGESTPNVDDNEEKIINNTEQQKVDSTKQNDNNSEKKEVEKDGSQENNKEGKISDVPVSDTVDNTVPLTTEVLGITGKAYTEVGTEIQFRYEVVGASQLIASHDTALRANEEYPSELQPRDRSRQASQQQIKTIAQKLNPELLADSAKASDGAPIVSSDYIVESGNGRTIAIQKMYQEKYATGVKYKSYLVENAEKFGLDAEKVKAMDNPVLVRVRTNEVNRQEFVEEANVSNVAAMSSVEQAVADSKKLTDKVMYLFSPSEQGDLNVASNQAFISQFIQSVVPNNERGILMTSDGALSQDGLRRVQNAILAKAYGNSEALMLMVESNDNNVKTLTNTLLQAAPSVVKMVDGIQNNAYYNEDISKDLVAAVEKFSELRSENTSVETFLNQTSLFDDGLSNVSKELLRLFDTGVVIDGKARKSVKAYKELIDTYVEVLQAAGNPNQQSLFKDAAPTKDELLVAAIQKVSNEDAGVQTNLFEDESESSQSTTETSGRKTSSNTDTFVRARGERNQAEVNKGETTRAEIISFIKENFNVRIDVGQYRQRAKGIFKNKFAIVRTKEYGDFEVIAHELGHRFDIKNGWSSDPTLKQEWIKFAEANLELPRDMTQVKKAKEGVAEYFRQYLYAETNAPVSYTELSQTLHDKVNASMKKAKWDKPLAATRAKMIDWLNRDAEQELRGVVAPIGQQKIRLTAKQFITKYYTKIFEKEHPIFDAIKKIEKELGIKIEGRSNAYQMAVLTRGTVARAATFIKRETFNSLTGERTGESLESILKDVDDVESFGRYLVARHGLYLIKKQGKSKTPLSPELMEEYLENGKHYEEHADRIYRYQNELLKVLVDGNLIPKDLPEALREKYP
ncbi:MAG: hypothetical protein RR595_12680, partial [Lysinibacillus sp.]